MNSSVINVYTDGSYDRNVKSCGLGYYIEHGKESFKRIGGKILGTSHEMEMLAVLNSLLFIDKHLKVNPERIVIHSDSNSIVEKINTFSMTNMVNEDVFRQQNSIWLKIVYFLQKYDVWGNWVKGHSSNRGNAIAHELANHGRLMAVKNLSFELFDMEDVGPVDVPEHEYTDTVRQKIREYNQQASKAAEEEIKARIKSGKPLRSKKYVLINENEEFVINMAVEENKVEIKTTENKSTNNLRDSMLLLKQLFVNSRAKTLILNIQDKEMYQAFNFFQKAIHNYQENISFLDERDKEMYKTISSGLKSLKNKKQDLFLKSLIN